MIRWREGDKQGVNKLVQDFSKSLSDVSMVAYGDRKDFLQILRLLPCLRQGKRRKICKRESCRDSAYITWKVSYTVIWPPLCKMGQLLATWAAESIESALIIEYPLASVPTGPSLTVPLLAMLLA